MVQLRRFLLIILFTIAALPSCKKETPLPADEGDFIIAGYLPYWGMEDVDFTIIQHLDILYFFSIAPDENGNFEVAPGIIDDINILKALIDASHTKLFIVVGGWYESETIFPMALDQAKRAAYISDLVNFCKQNGIDGVDLDWEGYPVSIVDSDHLRLVEDLSYALHGNGLDFTVAMMLSKYDLSAQMLNYVDYINVMGYESFDNEGNHMPMSMFEDYLGKFTNAGVYPGKIIMGVPYFGRRPYVEGDTSPRYLTYRAIVNAISPAPSVNRYGLYAFNGIDLVVQKTGYLLSGNYAGIMAWELSQDVDYNSAYSLTRAIVNKAGK